MDGMYLTEEIKGSISILPYGWDVLTEEIKGSISYCWSYGYVPYRGD